MGLVSKGHLAFSSWRKSYRRDLLHHTSTRALNLMFDSCSRSLNGPDRNLKRGVWLISTLHLGIGELMQFPTSQNVHDDWLFTECQITTFAPPHESWKGIFHTLHPSFPETCLTTHCDCHPPWSCAGATRRCPVK